MRFELAILAISISTVAAVAQSAAVNDKIFNTIKAEVSQKIVSSNVITKIDAQYYINPDCSFYGDVQYRVLRKPSHGDITFSKGEGFPYFTNDNVRASCNSHKTPTLDVNYRPSDGYTGEDRIEIIYIYGDGSANRFDYNIIVG